MALKPSSSLREAQTILTRCRKLGRISEEPGRLTRTFHSPAMARANRLVGSWMRQAGLAVREDAAWNLIGRWPRRSGPALLIGSHLDTVRNAGLYDGPLGVLLGIAVVDRIRRSGRIPPFAMEVIGFSDEEGVRYQTAYLGSRAMTGQLTSRDLSRIREKGIVRARRPAGDFLGYLEAHIEQGPVLEKEDLALGVVGAIAGQSRIRISLTGQAGHAGTTPMRLRRDALAGAAEIIRAVETCGITGTVGQISVEPGASNVIPGRAVLTVDLRHVTDTRRRRAVAMLHRFSKQVARKRGLRLLCEVVQETAAVPMDRNLSQLLSSGIRQRQRRALSLPSGAGHDAAIMARRCPAAMLFLRCRKGISHHPDESVKLADVAAALDALTAAVLRFVSLHA